MSRRSRQDEEFSAFAAARSTNLYRNAWLLTTSTAAAEDLLQSTLAKVYASWSRVSAADDPVAYAHGVLIKTFLSDKRRRSSSEVPVADHDLRADDRSGLAPTDPVDRIVLMAALRELAPLDRAVVVLRYWEDRTVAETARLLHLSEAAVKNRSLRSLRALRELLTDPADEADEAEPGGRVAATTAPPTSRSHR